MGRVVSQHNTDTAPKTWHKCGDYWWCSVSAWVDKSLWWETHQSSLHWNTFADKKQEELFIKSWSTNRAVTQLDRTKWGWKVNSWNNHTKSTKARAGTKTCRKRRLRTSSNGTKRRHCTSNTWPTMLKNLWKSCISSLWLDRIFSTSPSNVDTLNWSEILYR